MKTLDCAFDNQLKRFSVNQNPYKKYKPSGVKWLEDVPEHWGLMRLKMISTVVDIKVKADQEESVLYVGMENVEPWTGQLSLMENTLPTGVVNRFTEIHTLFGKLRPYLAKAYNPDSCGICSTEFIVIKSTKIDRSLLLYLLLNAGSIHLIDSSSYGVKMPRVSWSILGDLVLPLPSKNEQKSIVSFLERKIKSIDSLVRKDQILIERIREKRIALISHTITHGLPADATQLSDLSLASKRKPSGIQWLGDIPEHWDVLRLKYVASINDEALTEATDPSFEMSYVDIGSVDPIRGIVSSEEMIFEDAPSRARRIVRDGDTIISTVRTYLRAIAPVRNPEKKNMIVSTGFAVVRPREISPRFLAYLLSDPRFVSEIMARSVGVSYPAVNAADIGNISIAVPGRIEQESIAEFLDRETARLDTIVSKVEMAIRRLGEYRNALVTAAVTGKIDVRKVEQAVVGNGTKR